MIIHCEKCERKFKVDASRIKPEGSKVRCSKCGHIFIALRDEPETVIEDTELNNEDLMNSRNETSEQSAPGNEKQEPGDEMLDIELDRTPNDDSNWEEFVNITKTSTKDPDTKDPESGSAEETTTETEQGDFTWGKLSLDDEAPEAEPKMPEMFEDEGSSDEPKAEEQPEAQPREEDIETGVYARRKERESLILDTDAQDKHDDIEGYYGKASEATMHRGVYHSQKPKKNIFGKILSTLMIAAVFVIIIVASLTILINLELIPEDQVLRAKVLVESVLPVSLGPEEAESIVITQHGGSWVSTRYGPLYVVSGLLKNVSTTPVHYIQLRSQFVSAGNTLYEDTVYAGNTFTENELKLSRTEDIVFKLKNKNGDIDYYNMDKLSGRNYDIKPGDTIPFFAVFPSDRTILGLKYNLQVVGYEGPSVN